MKLRSVALVLSFGVVACSPKGREQAGGSPDAVDNPPDAAPAFGAEICNDGIDNDQDGTTDCMDQECAGTESCPICEPPTTQALSLPDGYDLDGGGCSSNAACSTGYCVAGYCADPYISQAIWSTFAAGATLTNPNQLRKVCLNIEHSWLADTQIELVTPNDVHLILHAYNRNNARGIYLGDANDNDTASVPVPGVGNDYCFTPTASPLLWQGTRVNAADGEEKIKPGDYASATPWSVLAGTPLNGTWKLQVTDLWRVDNGFLFSWSMEFDPAIAPAGCGPVIIY
jgi:subtilisin-like proprotein convertase family protein